MFTGTAHTDWNSRGNGLRQVIEYVILGTSHCVQDSSEFERPVMDAIQKHAIRLVAEEYTCDSPSMVSVTTKRLHIPYLQVDLFPEEWAAHGIDSEMRIREQLFAGQDVRLSHADAVREDFWLEKIEKSIELGRVLIICGYLHLDFLAGKIRERGGKVLDRSTFPVVLLGRKPTKIFSPSELKQYLRDQGENAGR